MRKNCLFLLCLLTTMTSFAVTAEAGVIRKSEKSAIQTGQLGAIIPSITESGKKCSFGEIAFRNLQTGRLHKGKFSNPSSFLSTPRARVLALQPGYYQPVYAECVWNTSVMRQKQFFRGLDRAYQPILVRGGEVVYYGTFDVQIQPGTKNYKFNLIGNPRGTFDSLVRVDRKLAKHFVERPVHRR